MPGPGVDLIGEDELAELRDVISSRRLSRYGPDDGSFPAKVRRLERAVAEMAGVDYALALNSGTSGLLVALAALDIGPGDEVIVPGFTFVASISAIVYAGATPVLAEIDRSFDLDPADVEARITPNTKAIMLVHMLGNPGRLSEIKAIAERHAVALIEDAAQAFGATYQGRWVGTHGQMGVYSFNEYKTITCGDGGMVVTNDENLYRRAFAMHDQGHSPGRSGMEVGARPFLGLNFRMTELEGAVLVAQVRRVAAIRAHLSSNAALVRSIIEEVPMIDFRELPDPEGDLATHLVVIFPTERMADFVTSELGSITLDRSGWHVYAHMEHLLARRTATERGYPFGQDGHASPTYRAGMLPATDALLARSMSFSIGVQDPNLAPFGLRMRDDAEVAVERALRFREVALRYSD
jgi:dTDP-4-amino-4,6-dideoxygalactose transaminase